MDLEKRPMVRLTTEMHKNLLAAREKHVIDGGQVMNFTEWVHFVLTKGLKATK